jgi:hypothetical protein
VLLSLSPKPPPPQAVLIPEVVFWLIATVGLHTQATMATAPETFWKSLRAVLTYLPSKPITEEAFCMARAVLGLRFFVAVFRYVLECFEEKLGRLYRWKGLRLLGIDGMKTPLAKSAELGERFPPHSGGKGASEQPQGLLVGLVGLWDGLCRGFHLVPNKTSEQRCAQMLARHLRPKDLLLCDKNFPGYRFFVTILSHGADFLFRLPSNRYKNLRRIPTPSARRDEWYLDVPCPKKLPKRRLELPAYLRLRVIRYQIRGFRPSLLITSLLDTEVYPYDELVALYHERWRQETMHREWKYTLSISNLRSKTCRGIFKEILVQLTVNNLVRWIMAQAGGQKYRPVDLSFLEAKRRIVNTAEVMATAKVEDLPRLYRTLLEEIAEEVILVRPGRSYPRRYDREPRNKGHGEFALPARLMPDEEEHKMAI